jgi:transforming growth factor-beta-induced protein
VSAQESAAAAACPDNGVQNIAEIATADPTGQLSTLLAAVQSVNLTSVLASDGPLDVFAPTNDAFAAVLDAYEITAEELLAQTAFVTRVLQYHVVADGAVCSGDLSGSVPTALPGESLTVDGDTVTDATGNTANILVSVPASNGMVYVIDSVLLPTPDAAAPGAEEGNEYLKGWRVPQYTYIIDSLAVDLID